MISNVHQINKRNISSIPIEISKKKIFSKRNQNNEKKFYSLTENVFDPSKFSPPNVFIENLKKRMNFYEDSKVDILFDNN
jgi:hypothetical protein